MVCYNNKGLARNVRVHRIKGQQMSINCGFALSFYFNKPSNETLISPNLPALASDDNSVTVATESSAPGGRGFKASKKAAKGEGPRPESRRSARAGRLKMARGLCRHAPAAPYGRFSLSGRSRSCKRETLLRITRHSNALQGSASGFGQQKQDSQITTRAGRANSEGGKPRPVGPHAVRRTIKSGPQSLTLISTII